MKTNNLLSAKATLLTILILFGVSRASNASSFIASFSGNWSNASNWDGGRPGFDISSNDNVVIPSGVTLVLDADLTVNGNLTLNGGSLNLNGKNLTIIGGISSIGLGSLIGNKSSDITFNGFGGAGNLVFASGSQVINNLTINIGANSGMFLGSGLTVAGTLTLTNGFLAIGNYNLLIAGKGSIQGGSSSSYVMNNGTGSLMIDVPNNNMPFVFHVGTQNNYAPVAITNNSTSSGVFAVTAQEGVLALGTSGNDMCDAQRMVNTSWNVSSSIADNTNIKLELFWNTNMQVNGFNNTQAYMSQYTSTGWNTAEATTATLNSNGSFSLKLEGVTSLTQFAVFGKNSTTGIKNVAADASFNLYPNPATQTINIEVAATTNFPILKIFDVAGNQVISQQVENNVTSLDINGLSRGVYFASLNGAAATKFIKE